MFQAGGHRRGQHVEKQTFGPGLLAIARADEVLQQHIRRARDAGDIEHEEHDHAAAGYVWRAGCPHGIDRSRHRYQTDERDEPRDCPPRPANNNAPTGELNAHRHTAEGS